MVSFRGRARVVDLIYFGLAICLIRLVAKLPLEARAWDVNWFANAAVDIVILVPCLALFCRRLHDQGLSGWWALLLVPGPLVDLHQSYRAVFAVVNPEWLFQSDPLNGWGMVMIPVGLVVLVLALRPGTRGPNRYGPDPRKEQVLAV